MINIKLELLVLDGNTWKHLTVCEQMSSNSFKNKITNKLFAYKPYIYMCVCVCVCEFGH